MTRLQNESKFIFYSDSVKLDIELFKQYNIIGILSKKSSYRHVEMQMIKKRFKYIDLFAGIGGFHQAMRRLGGRCVYACEKNDDCRTFYDRNYNQDGSIKFHDDVRTIRPEDIPDFDVLCAGFPCQPFSKAGMRLGFEDKGRGDLFYSLLPILDRHQEAKFVILENVRNLADNEANWDVIKTELMKRDFFITEEPIILSPHQFGIPQIRERVYILGIRKRYRNTKTLRNGYIHREDLHLEDRMLPCPHNSLPLILDQDVPKQYLLSDELVYVINAWNELKTRTNLGIIGKPIWMDYFGIHEDNYEKIKLATDYYKMPKWKQEYVDWNRAFYLKNRQIIDEWDREFCLSQDPNKLHRKFEWNCGIDCNDVRDGIIQIRQSGIRVKRPDFFPSLVVMNNTPIVWDSIKRTYRYITPKEAAKLQSFDTDIIFLEDDRTTYKQLGNSVNVNIIELLASRLFDLGMWRLRRKQNG